MRTRFLVALIALAILTAVGMRSGGDPATTDGRSHGESGQFGAPPASEPGAPAVIAPAPSTSATLQTALMVESGRQASPALSVSALSHHPRVIARSTGKPISFPLLI